VTNHETSSPVKEFKHEAEAFAEDRDQRAFLNRALGGYYLKRDENMAKFQDWEQARSAAAEVKYEAVNNLAKNLELFEKNFTARGGKVHWARNAAEAREVIMAIIRDAKAHSIIKSKCMTSEEIHLNDALVAEGFDVVESDLGEFIVQLRGEAPFHFVFPAMHLKRGEISRLFQEKLGSQPTDSPEELTMIARDVMRKKYCDADVGMSGANFAVAETGMISITENEGNARLTIGLPRVHIALMGIEKVIPRLVDLALFLPMLATAGAGQQLTCYNTLVGGPRREGECDGPRECHVVLLDNHRTALLADPEQRDALHCIRCGACLNVCPIFKNVGGHTYGTTYAGPIGSVITPHLRGLQDWKHLSGASSLCGACTSACPVRIDIHHHLLHNRRNAMTEKGVWWERLAWKGFAAFMSNHTLYRASMPLARIGSRVHKLIAGSMFDPMRAWTKKRDLPPLPQSTFREQWRRERGSRDGGAR
jgi:L-lactate dehydrogenase complex protein LldF